MTCARPDSGLPVCHQNTQNHEPVKEQPLKELGATSVRRTLFAIALAVLVSMLLAPHGGKSGVEGVGPFLSTNGLDIGSGGFGYVGRVMIDMLALEMIF